MFRNYELSDESDEVMKVIGRGSELRFDIPCLGKQIKDVLCL